MWTKVKKWESQYWKAFLSTGISWDIHKRSCEKYEKLCSSWSNFLHNLWFLLKCLTTDKKNFYLQALRLRQYTSLAYKGIFVPEIRSSIAKGQQKEEYCLSVKTMQTYWKMNDPVSTQYQPHWSLLSLIYWRLTFSSITMIIMVHYCRSDPQK